MSDFINNPDFGHNTKLAYNLYLKQEYLKGVQNVTYDINNNNFNLNYNDGTSIDMHSTSQMLDYYFGENLSDVIADDKIYIVHQSSYDMIFYEGTFIGYGVTDSTANEAFEKALDTEIKGLVNDTTFIDDCINFIENDISGSVATGTIMPAVLDIYDNLNENNISSKYSTCLSLALIYYHLNNTGDDNSVNNTEWLDAFSTAFSFDTNPFTSAILTGLPTVTNIISNEAEAKINFYISQEGEINPGFNTTTPINGRSLKEWMEENGFEPNIENIPFTYTGDISIEFDYETVLKKYNSDLKIDLIDNEVTLKEWGEYLKACFKFYSTGEFGEWFYDYIHETKEINPISDKVKGKYLSEVKTQTLTASNTVYDPIILDLDGDGYNIETKENGANFDLDKNGFAERINWTSKDGFLCLDLNNNGTIDDGGELFGDKTLLANGTEATNGFEALAQYDSNSDGVIDENDEIYGNLRVWVDGDGNGVSGEGELKTLADLGITSINLAYENVNAETGTEATIGNSATFTYADGTVGNAGELWVSSDLFDTVDKIDIEIPDDIKDLPNVGSIGNVYSLHNAMALDETGELKALVESFAAEQDMDKRMETVQKILYFITGANDVADGSRGAYMDAKQLAVIEAMLGEDYVGTTGRNPHSDAAPMLKEAYADLLNMYYSELAAQTYIKDYVQLLRYTENEDGTKVLNADFVNYILEYQLANGDENAKKILGDVARYVQYLDNGGIKGMSAFVANYAAISSEYAAEIVNAIQNGYVADGVNALNGTGSADFLVGSANGETISAGNGSDVIIGGKGDDKLYGSYDNDTYIFNLGDGNDIIEDYAPHVSNSKADKVVFGEGISLEDIIVDRTGNDMILRIKDTDDSIRIVNQYTNEYYRVENFEFADGTTVAASHFFNTPITITGSGEFNDYTGGFGINSTTIYGSDIADTINAYEGNDHIETGLGNDIVYGGNGADTFIGGNGDDKLYGSYDNDTYIFNIGDGNDIIEDYALHVSNSKADKVVFGEGITLEDIIVDRTGNDMILRIKDTDDSIRIVNQYTNEYYRVENFEFADGTTVAASHFFNTPITITGSGEFNDYTGGFEINSTTIYGSDIADTINAYEGNDHIETGLGNDIVYGGNGADTFVGGNGDDKLFGSYDNDTYIFNLGDGNDIIEDYAPHVSNSKADKVVFGEEILIDDIIFSKSGNNLVIGFTDTDDSITITNHNSNDYYRVENFATSDGYTIDYSKVNQLIQAMASFEADTGMSWTEAVEQDNETANSIISEMWVKSVS